MKSLSKVGKITKKEKAEPFTLEEENYMWDSGVLGQDNPEQLLNTLLYILGVHLSLHAVEEHKGLKTGYYSQIKVKYDKQRECKFLEYTESRSKNHQGGICNFNHKPKVVYAYANKDNPARCVLNLYTKYLALRPTHDPKCSYDLYLHPLKHYSEHIWYSCQPLGINTLQHVVLKLANCANLRGKHTNHSLRATGPTRMYETGMDDKLVCNLTGHCSNAVLEYKHTSKEMKNHVSQVLYGNAQSYVLVKTMEVKPKVNDHYENNLSQELFGPTELQVVVPSSQQSQAVSNFMVNYNIPKDSNMPAINVYPIINIPQGLSLGTPVIVNVNLHM